MAGSTRGKLKEHFEGIHKNLDWCIHHVAQSANLIEQQLRKHSDFAEIEGLPDKELEFFKKHPLYRGVIAMGEGLQQFDEMAKGIYDNI